MKAETYKTAPSSCKQLRFGDAWRRIKLTHMRRTIITFLCVLFWNTASASTYNIAPKARAKASSGQATASCVNDGIIRVVGKGSWQSDVKMAFWGEIDFPWIELEWDSAQEIDRVLLYDRPEAECTCSGGELVFDDGERLLVRGIPANGAPKEITFPAKRTRSLRFEITDGDGNNIGLSEIEVYATPTDYVSTVDPYIETTRGRYFFFATGSQPFGMISAAPLTRNKNQGGGGYNYNSTEVLGFPQIHAWMLSGLDIMPTTDDGGFHFPADATKGEQAWKSAFTHEGELVQPGYHRLYLERYHTWVEQTCTDRVSLYRLTYTRESQAHILLNLGGYISTSTMVNAHVTGTTERGIEGYFDSTGRLWGGPDKVRMFFSVEFDKPFASLTPFGDMDAQLTSHTPATPRNQGWSYADAPVAGISADYSMQAGEQLHVKMAISYTSIENARQNLTELPTFDFDATRRASQAEWNEMLGRIEVKGGERADHTKLYTDLWHSLLGRHKLDDLSGDYPDYTQGGTVEDSHVKGALLRVRHLERTAQSPLHIYNSDAVWLTMWNLNILWGLAYPEVLDDFAGSFLQYSLNGGLLARGPCAGGYSWIMCGCPATSLITSAYQRGLMRRYKPLTALQEMVRNHEKGGMLAYGMNDDLAFYEENGYVPNAAGLTIQWAFEDWALAEMAERMGKRKIANRFHRRSAGWEASFHPEQKLVFPRKRDGEWVHTNPLSGQGYIEANAWQATFGLSHAIPRLTTLMGGTDSLCARLNYAFEQAAKSDFMASYSNGYMSYSNQPGLSNAHVFAHAGRPDLTQYWVRRVRRQAYGGITPDKGYGGHDEDQGQMASLSALMSIGLFSIDGGSSSHPAYDITSPIFDEVNIRLNQDYYTGNSFRIVVHDNSPENCYIQRMTLNGQTLKGYQISHDQYQQGGTLEVWLGPKPVFI